MRKILYILLAGALLCPTVSNFSVANAASYSSLDAEEKKAFDKLYQPSSTSTLQNVSVSYSADLSGINNISSYHWTAWKKVAKGAGINKKANSGKGIGSGSYDGFTQKKIDSWKKEEKYIKAIKDLNKGKFPADGNYIFPTDTTSPKLSWWVDEVGFYDFMSDPKYSKITLNGYRTFKWTEKVKKTNIKEKTEGKSFITAGGSSSGLSWDDDALRANLISYINTYKYYLDTNQSANNIAKKLMKAMAKKEITSGKDEGYTKGTSSITIKNGNHEFIFNVTIKPGKKYEDTDATTGARFYDVKLTKKTKTTTVSYKTLNHTKKQKIAQTVVAKNAYATEIAKYQNFKLVPKSKISSKKIKTVENGFWYGVTPYYHKAPTSVTDEGSYDYTFSNQVSSGEYTAYVYTMLPVKSKLFTDFADNVLSAEGIANPPLDENNNNNGNNNNGGNPGNNGNNPGGNDENNPGGNNPGGNNGNNPGGNNNNGGKPGGHSDGNQSSIGDKTNSPMINVEIDAKNDNPGQIGIRYVASQFHLVDINDIKD